jgi:hypothetical protein
VRARVTSIALASLLVAGLTGCTFTATQATQLVYDPSDGVGAGIGDVDIQNALLITEDGQRGGLVVSLINSGSRDVALKVSWESASGERVERNVNLAAGSSRTLGTDSDPIVLDDVDAAPGSLFPVYFQYGKNEGRELAVPVLTNELEEYSDLLPAEVAE